MSHPYLSYSLHILPLSFFLFFFFFNDTATTEIYTLSLHDALPISGVLVLAAAVVGAVLLERWPWLLALGVLACVPARIEVKIGSEKASLLIPLYGIVLAAALALGYRLLRGDSRTRELGPIAWPLAAFVAWSGLSLAWTSDLRQGSIELLFF